MNVTTPCRRLLAAAALMLVAGLAQAQYVWIDDERHQAVLGPLAAAVGAGEEHPEGAGTRSRWCWSPAGPRRRRSAGAGSKRRRRRVAERKSDFNKRAAEKAEQDKKAAAEAQARRRRPNNCAAARAYKTQLESGMRIGTSRRTGSWRARASMRDADALQLPNGAADRSKRRWPICRQARRSPSSTPAAAFFSPRAGAANPSDRPPAGGRFRCGRARAARCRAASSCRRCRPAASPGRSRECRAAPRSARSPARWSCPAPPPASRRNSLRGGRRSTTCT